MLSANRSIFYLRDDETASAIPNRRVYQDGSEPLDEDQIELRYRMNAVNQSIEACDEPGYGWDQLILDFNIHCHGEDNFDVRFSSCSSLIWYEFESIQRSYDSSLDNDSELEELHQESPPLPHGFQCGSFEYEPIDPKLWEVRLLLPLPHNNENASPIRAKLSTYSLLQHHCFRAVRTS